MSTGRSDVGLEPDPLGSGSTSPPSAGRSVASVTPPRVERFQNDEMLATWREFQEAPIEPPERLLEALGPMREAFLDYLHAPDRDHAGRGIALLDLCVERTLEAAISLSEPGLVEQIRGCLVSAVGARTELEVRSHAAEALDLVRQGAAAFTAWEATGRAVERRDRAIRETMRVRQSQGSTVSAAAAMDALAKAVASVVRWVPIEHRDSARRDLERALDERSQALRAGMRWWLDGMFSRSEAAR